MAYRSSGESATWGDDSRRNSVVSSVVGTPTDEQGSDSANVVADAGAGAEADTEVSAEPEVQVEAKSEAGSAEGAFDDEEGASTVLDNTSEVTKVRRASTVAVHGSVHVANRGMRKASVQALAGDEDLDWLLDDTPRPVGEQATSSAVPDEVRVQLAELLPGFARVSVEGVCAVPPAAAALRAALAKSVIRNARLCPSDACASSICAELEVAKQRRVKSRSRLFENSYTTDKEQHEAPCDSDMLRKDSTQFEHDNMLARWRLVLVRVHSREQPGHRFVEEYPWLLERNGRWAALLQCVADLRVLRLLWGGSALFRGDLLRYWKRLASTCPLGSAAAAGAVAGAASETEAEALMATISEGCEEKEEDKADDACAALDSGGSLDSSAVAPDPTERVDPVDHYARALEEHMLLLNQSSEYGDATEFLRHNAALAATVSSFFWELGSAEKLAPQYLHPAIDEVELAQLKVDMPHCRASAGGVRPNSQGSQSPPAKNIVDLSVTGKELVRIAQIREAMMLEQHMAQRVQAASKLADPAQREQLMQLRRRQSKFFRFVLDQHEERASSEGRERAGQLGFAGNQHGANFYSYQRWLWLHWPTLSLMHAHSTVMLTGSERRRTVALPKVKTTKFGGSSATGKPKPRLPVPAGVATAIVRNPGAGAAAPAGLLQRRDSSMGDFWDRKKQSPQEERTLLPRPSMLIMGLSREELFEQLESKLAAARSPNSGAAAARALREAEGEFKDKDGDDEDAARGRALALSVPRSPGDPSLLTRGVGPFFRDVKNLPPNTVPFSSPTNRTLRTGTKFPTFGKAYEQDTLLNVFHGGNLDAAAIRESFKGQLTEAPAGRSTVVSFVASNLPSHMQPYVPTEQEARMADLNGMVSAMRKEFDALRAEAEAKERHLDVIMQQVYERQEVDKLMERVMESGEDCLGRINEQLQFVTEEADKAEHVNRYLTRVAAECETFPAWVEKHILDFEARVSEMREDRLTLAKAQDEVVLFIRAATTEQKPALEQALAQRKQMHEAVLAKLHRWREQQTDEAMFNKARREGRAEIVRTIRSTPTNIAETHHHWSLHRQMLYANVLPLEYARLAHERKLVTAFRRVSGAAKSTDPDEIAKAFAALPARAEVLAAEAELALARRDQAKDRALESRTALQAARKEARAEAVERGTPEGATRRAAPGVESQLQANLARAEKRLAASREDRIVALRGVAEMREAVQGFHHALQAIGVSVPAPPGVLLMDLAPHLRKSQQHQDDFSSADADDLRDYFEELLAKLGCGSVNVPEPGDATAAAMPRRARASRQDEVQRRKFLFGGGVRKSIGGIVQLPPRIEPKR